MLKFISEGIISPRSKYAANVEHSVLTAGRASLVPCGKEDGIKFRLNGPRKGNVPRVGEHFIIQRKFISQAQNPQQGISWLIVSGVLINNSRRAASAWAWQRRLTSQVLAEREAARPFQKRRFPTPFQDALPLPSPANESRHHPQENAT